MLDINIIDTLRSGCVIPAHPLALNKARNLDENVWGSLLELSTVCPNRQLPLPSQI